ncbi:transposase [Krasilnikovia sp. MM14-A1004]|uniref:transposase n=1 Tax=Krasilnikovia sp. MM14-A1004 TaxID=3373541 RepID=UPI00399C4C68
MPDRSPPRGRWADHREVIEAIAWEYRTGSPWRDLPDKVAVHYQAALTLAGILLWIKPGSERRFLATAERRAEPRPTRWAGRRSDHTPPRPSSSPRTRRPTRHL